MLYVSTRGKTDLISSAHAIARGLAEDGGLFVPQRIPVMRLADIKAMSNKPYTERAIDVLLQYLTDFTEAELRECVNAAYDKKKFGENPVPLVQVNDNTGVLELWHGPTSAFKDMALQLLPHLLIRSMAKSGETNKVVILVATSGDTGKAALEGFVDVEGTQIIVFYPCEGVSDIQKRQMITQTGKNVKVFGIEGNFDDAQRGVKEIFNNIVLGDELEKNGYSFSSANSINWGRLVPQIVYYFSAYVDAVQAGKVNFGEPINFVVPTGNFGDILAGYYAKLMGLPIERLLCASNSNKVLTDFINTGIYDKRREFFKTISPSMDILVSSNLERLLYSVTDQNAEQVADYMKRLNTEGLYQIDNDVLKRIQREFFGAWVDELETKEAIGRIYSDYKYLLDTHTAVAWRALEKYRFLTSDDTYTIVLSTASPYKFADSVLDALDDAQPAGSDPFANLAELHEKTGVEIPPRMLALKDMPVLHNEIIPADKMELAVVKNLL
ncbi:threonine synthase [uncultured Phascolarctobacterium sp.]|uniref:threonine synthase n=1 Tax=uncultured Phascolarctobacterium sp. TaxID=512296 RepID=UPI002623C30C|nr:threonine synthase [uncultured Phascolarctobacterium sp.]